MRIAGKWLHFRRFGSIMLLIGYAAVSTGFITYLHLQEAGHDHDSHSCTLCHQITGVFTAVAESVTIPLIQPADGRWDIAEPTAPGFVADNYQPHSPRAPPLV